LASSDSPVAQLHHLVLAFDHVKDIVGKVEGLKNDDTSALVVGK